MTRIALALLFLFLHSFAAAAADEQAREYGEYLAGECTTCHSRSAKASSDTGIPPLADISGWEQDAFIGVMQSFKTGERTNPAMISVAKALDEEQLKALAVYFGSLKPATDAADAVVLTPFKWSPEIIKQAKSGNPANGQKLAGDIGCSGCHGEKGISEDPNMPNLAGQGAAYILKQLYDFKQGARKSEFMVEPVKTLSLAQIADLAAWYAGHNLLAAGGSKGKDNGAAKVLALKGDKARLLIGCNICHGIDGVGRAVEVPAIRGQKRDYLLKTLLAFKTGKRTNDHYKRMGFIAGVLTSEEIEQLADHYAQAAPPAGGTKVSLQMKQAIAASSGASASGKKAWRKCRSCHTIKKGARNKVGPNLYNIVGSKAGSVGKYRYSKLLKKKGQSGLVWTEQNLDAWLANPRKFIGGRTKMSSRTGNAELRASIIGYLKTFAKGAKP